LAIHGHECRITASIGISMFPTDALDAETLIKNADAAMYVAKEVVGGGETPRERAKVIDVTSNPDQKR
jgi:GGDEF domain-containing protein